jgi:hypothetical protein
MGGMIINSFSLAVAIVAALVALICCGLAVQGFNRDRRRSRPGLVERLEVERATRERRRMEQATY